MGRSRLSPSTGTLGQSNRRWRTLNGLTIPETPSPGPRRAAGSEGFGTNRAHAAFELTPICWHGPQDPVSTPTRGPSSAMFASEREAITAFEEAYRRPPRGATRWGAVTTDMERSRRFSVRRTEGWGVQCSLGFWQLNARTCRRRSHSRCSRPRSARLASVRKQYHLRPGSSGLDAWDVDRLIELSQDLPVVEVPVESIGEVDSNYWFGGDFGEPTVRKLVEHMRLVRDVDPVFPIILGVDGRVMDGMHRIARALLEGWPTIRAVRFETQPKPDFRDCSPGDLYC